MLCAVCVGRTALEPGPRTLTLLTAAGVVALLGLVHDLRPLRARPQLVVEAAAAIAVVYGSGLTPLSGALAVLWIVLVTHAFGGLDHADGAAGLVGVVTAIGLALGAAAAGLAGLALVLSVLAASVGGFLVHNWQPARIHLGTCGARFLGFLLASAAILVHVGHPALPSVAALFALTAVVSADVVLALLARLSRRRAGRPLPPVGADHIAYRLRRVGLTAQGTAVVLAVFAVAGTLTGLLVHRGTLGPAAVLPLAGVLLLAVGGLLAVRVYGAGASPRTSRTRAPGAGGGAPPLPPSPPGRVAAPRSARSAPRASGVRLPLPGHGFRRRADDVPPQSAADLARG